ncbi:MAG: redox-sensing transcriptional repressor Rex [Treponema sp.]|jgi:redox-sensing transcriptional repressor|nr:redox-sensing transcriptional repressor Rex [Treponema sp.]
MGDMRISAAPSIRRLPSYLHIIRSVQREGEDFISGTVIAQELNLESIQVRKDLSITGITGKPKKGYPIEPLINAIERFLNWDSPQDAVLIGVGNLGSALLGYQEFQLHGLHIMAAFDNNPKKIGTAIHGIRIMNAGTMDIQIRNFGVKIAILTVPSDSAQKTTDILTASGIEGIWNFTNVKLKVPGNTVVQKEDLSSGYAMLCVKMSTKRGDK